MKTRIKVQQIIIDLPKDEQEIWIHIATAKLTYDDEGNIISTVPRNGYISRPFKKVAMEMFDLIDPVLDLNHKISGVGLNLAVSNAALKWVAEDMGGTLTEGKLWL